MEGHPVHNESPTLPVAECSECGKQIDTDEEGLFVKYFGWICEKCEEDPPA